MSHDNAKPHRNLLCWQKSMDLVVEIYQITRTLPKEELYGLTSQIRRAAVSAPANVAEGAAGRSSAQFRNSLEVAIGSLNELSTLLELCTRIGYLNKAAFENLLAQVDECLALTFGLKKSLRE